MKDLVKKKIIAILPYYTKEGGNYTKVRLFKGEEVLIKKNINSSLKCLCQYCHYDLKSSKKTSREVLGIKKTPPIAINEDMVFIAIKTRKPIGQDDGAHSYINIESIKRFKDGNIDFKNGSSLKVDCKFKTIEKNIKQARLLKDIVYSRNIFIKEDDEVYIKEESFKVDLELLYKKLIEIEKNLFK